jgi:hypothetical protein
VIYTTPTGATEAITGLLPLDLVIHDEAMSAAHRLWILGCLSSLPRSGMHSSILMRLQKSDPIFNMGDDVMRPPFNLEPKCRITMLTREQ